MTSAARGYELATVDTWREQAARRRVLAVIGQARRTGGLGGRTLDTAAQELRARWRQGLRIMDVMLFSPHTEAAAAAAVSCQVSAVGVESSEFSTKTGQAGAPAAIRSNPESPES